MFLLRGSQSASELRVAVVRRAFKENELMAAICSREALTFDQRRGAIVSIPILILHIA
jgi:hypothetical protein